MMRSAIVRLILSALLPAASLHAESTVGEDLFVRRIAPLLHEKCLACHGQDETRIKGGFDLRSRELVVAGGDSGLPGLVPGKPEDSPL